ncbi:MAG: aminoacetone oxidase family FAD-binding enzyme [bacterium]|nr:aminoacetone oxidase family FAD-binding enzyme [bacterium]
MTRIAIIGGGPAGLMCAIIAKRSNTENEITIFEKNDIAATLLPTGGGRCNISRYSTDIKDFAQNYPRGEKFLYSVFNQFFVQDAIEFFESIGIKTYTQEDERIFPVSNKSLDVIFALKNEVKKLGIRVINTQIEEIKIIDNGFVVDNKYFEKLVVATGGKDNKILHTLGHNIIPQKPAMFSFEIKENFLLEAAGVSIRNITANAKFGNKQIEVSCDLLFTHKGISGPIAYKTSSFFASEPYSSNNPIRLKVDFVGEELSLQNLFDANPQKEILNIVSAFVPKSLGKILLEHSNISSEKKACIINKNEREIINDFLRGLEINAVAPVPNSGIVSAGGVDLNEINPKTMESKIHKNLYFCGEVVNIDGLCGGYNLQNCWSTGYVAGISL